MNIKNTVRSYIQRACSIRSLTLILIWVYMLDTLLQGYRVQAAAYGVRDAFAILPFVQADGYFLKVMLIGVLCFFSNAPFMNRNEMYVILRTGRRRWGRRNIGYIFACSIVLAVLLAVISTLMILPAANFSNHWGSLYKTLALQSGTLVFPIVDEAMIRYTPVQLMGCIILIDSLAFSFMGMFLYTLSLYSNRILTYLLTIILIFLPTIEAFIPWSIVYYSPFSWINPQKWRYGTMLEYPNLTYIMTAYIFLLFLLVLASQKKMDSVEWNETEE